MKSTVYLSLDEVLELLGQEAAASPAADAGIDNTLRELLRGGRVRAYRDENGDLNFVATEHCHTN